MAGSRTEVDGFIYEWVEQLDSSMVGQIRGLFNAVLETETVIGFPRPLRSDEGSDFFEGLAFDIRLKRKQLLMIREGGEHAAGMVILAQNSQPNCQHIAELSKCIIHPVYRGQRILDEGLKVVIARCQDIGVDIVTMDVRKGSRAEKIWLQLGFVPFGELGDYARVNGRREAGIFMSANIQDLGRARR